MVEYNFNRLFIHFMAPGVAFTIMASSIANFFMRQFLNTVLKDKNSGKDLSLTS